MLAFVEFSRYDEATSTLRVEQPSGIMDGAPASVASSEALAERALHFFDDDVTEVAPAKVFQTQQAWGALLASGEDVDRKYLVVSSSTGCVPQVLQRTTAANIAQAFIAGSFVR